jgi:hypothetical protein
LVEALGLRKSRKDPASIFPPRGKIALMFLKHYACCSDRKLIKMLNANSDWQFFCDIHTSNALNIGRRMAAKMKRAA